MSTFRFTWGDEVRVHHAASTAMRPGEDGWVCGMRVLATLRFYTVEFRDGISLEIPEQLLTLLARAPVVAGESDREPAMVARLDPVAFLKTVYLGDRACKGVHLDAWRRVVSIRVDTISRIRDPAGLWNFHDKEDIVDGAIVFVGVESLRLDPLGVIPNDYIHSIDAEPMQGSPATSPLYSFTMSVGSVDEAANHTEVVIRITARGVHLEDPGRAGIITS